MSDHAELLVCLTSDPPRIVADRVLAQLVASGIVEAAATPCTLGEGGHRPGPNVVDAVTGTDLSMLRMEVNGLEIRVPNEVELFGWGEHFEPSFACPSCSEDLDENTMYELLKQTPAHWSAVRCAACDETRPLWEWRIGAGAFGNIGFFFWNWPKLRRSFVEQVETWCEARVVRLHVMI